MNPVDSATWPIRCFDVEVTSRCNQACPRRPSMHATAKNIMGQVFGRLTVLAPAGTRNGARMWLCRCSCSPGRVIIADGRSLRSGGVRSCGCLRCKRRLPHAYWNNIYRWMLRRCYDSSCDQYKNYGQRGIAVCKRWRSSIEAFVSDMGPRPSRNHSLDRIDNDGNYEPGNCRWATWTEQAGNKRNNTMLTFNEKTMCLSAWARAVGIQRITLYRRIHVLRWSVERALTTPIRGSGANASGDV